jgi:hypothetical protein
MFVLSQAADTVRDGGLGALEATLAAQATTLNSMFTHFACQAADMTGPCLAQIDSLTRLALKCQGQYRASLETLALIRSGPTVFSRQTNLAIGPQQVNNALPPRSVGELPSRVGNPETERIKLLEAYAEPERLVGGTAGAAGGGDRALVPMAALDRTPKQ